MRALGSLLSDLPAAMVIDTHDLDSTARPCTRFLMVDGGRIVCNGADSGDSDHSSRAGLVRGGPFGKDGPRPAKSGLSMRRMVGLKYEGGLPFRVTVNP